MQTDSQHDLSAWKEFITSDLYKLAKNWAKQADGIDGALWAAFQQGHRAGVKHAEIGTVSLVEKI